MSNIRELSQLASVINVNDETKNVGIGTTNPESKLSVGGDLTASGNITAASFYGTVVGYATEGYVTQQISNLVGDAPEALNTLNELASALNDDSSFATTVTNSLSTKISSVGIQSAGVSVGAGITTLNFIGAGNTFAVNGNIVDISISGGGGGASVSISTEAPANPSSGDLWYSSVYGRTFIYYTDDDSEQWVDAAPFNLGLSTIDNISVSGDAYILGNLGVGSSNPQYSLDVLGDINFTGTFRQNGSQFVASRWTSGTGDDIYRLNGDVGIGTDNPTSKLDIIGDARVSGVVTAFEFSSSSDINLKTNIKSIDNPLEKIIQLNGVTFTWKQSQQDSIGIIAQEVEEIFPDLVKQLDTHKTVNYNGLIGVLIEAIKEQQKQIDELKKNTK